MGKLPGGEARRVALFVDGDNLSPSLSGPILQVAERLGQVDVRRVYAAEAGFRAWQDAPGYRPIQVGGAKNGTDLLLCIEAVELGCGGGFDAFALASDDRDFSHLAHWLRERGIHVLGLGTGKASGGWRAACSAFELLEADDVPSKPTSACKPVILRPQCPDGPTVGGGDPGGTAPQAEGAGQHSGAQKLQSLSLIDSRLRNLIAQSPHGVPLQSVGCSMSKAKHQPPTGKDWRSYLTTRADLYSLDPKGPTARVRWIGP